METPEAGFRRLYAAHVRAILAYAVRRVPPEDAADVVAETFLIVWRRWADVPPASSGGTRPWLYGVARRVLANQLRGEGRRNRLGDRLRHELASVEPDPADQLVETRALRQALARLEPGDREILELSAWEQLAPRDLAVILALSPEAARKRLSRARARLRRELEPDGHDPGRPGHLPGVPAILVPREDR